MRSGRQLRPYKRIFCKKGVSKQFVERVSAGIVIAIAGSRSKVSETYVFFLKTAKHACKIGFGNSVYRSIYAGQLIFGRTHESVNGL